MDFAKIGSVGNINFNDENNKKHIQEQPQVAFINSAFEGYFGGNNSGSEAAFNA